MHALRRAVVLVGLVGWAGCEKMPLHQVNATFTLAYSAYFAAERTLFVFYQVYADQGLGPESQLELRYDTDSEVRGWTSLADLTMVHTHVPVDCGPNSRCGSASVKVDLPPREVGVRLRYHRDGLMALETNAELYTVPESPLPKSRSLFVYGVFDERNRRVQWRARHQFPNLRNEAAQALGLRRWFRVDERWYGEVTVDNPENPYGYAFGSVCPEGLTPLGGGPLETLDRAAFDDGELPLEASSAPVVCARSFVTDANGGLEAPALARKNPEVRPAIPALKSPIRHDTPVGFLLEPCERTISEVHRAMQLQRLMLTEPEVVCVDDWEAPDFALNLAARFREGVDRARTAGDDMVLTIALHHDDTTGGLGAAVEDALEQVLPSERDKSSPRVSGAFVFDSVAHVMTRSALRSLVLWCPADRRSTLDEVPSAGAQYCRLLPEVPDVVLGPFRFNNLPILPTRGQYLSFIERYGEAQAGQVTGLTFLAPERTAVSQNVALGEYGVVTFFNGERIAAKPSDVFGYCRSPGVGVAFRVPRLSDPMPLEMLPQFHQELPQPLYDVGLYWDFPYLLQLRYETFLAGQVSAFSLSVPFGIKAEGERPYGASMWLKDTFPLADVLLQCTRFCEHPVFDSAGVYDPARTFRSHPDVQCHGVQFPEPGQGGFPYDP